MQNHVQSSQIHLVLPPTPTPVPIPTPAKKINGLSFESIGIIVGSICLAILLLGLGIGLPMRKQHKISMLQAKLNGRRIDKLSTANAMAFKKVVEATGSIKREIVKLSGDVKTLKAASLKPSKIKAKPNVNPTKSISSKPSVKPLTIKKVVLPKAPVKK